MVLEHAKKANKINIADFRLIRQYFLRTAKQSIVSSLNYEEFQQKLNKMTYELEEFSKIIKVLRSPQLKYYKMLVLLKNMKNMDSDFYSSLLNEKIKIEDILGENVDNGEYIPNFDNKSDRLGNGTIPMCAIAYLINISHITCIEFNDLIAYHENIINDTNTQILSLIKPIYLLENEKENYNCVKSLFLKSDIFYSIGKGYEFGETQLDHINEND